MKPCRDCGHEVSEQALKCPQCGAPYPAQPQWDGWGFEYKSSVRLLGLPLLHISFKYRPNRVPVPAVGIISIGQFGAGVFNISQFGFGIFSLSQITAGVFALAQIGLAWQLIAQVGIYVDEGYGQLVWKLSDLLR